MTRNKPIQIAEDEELRLSSEQVQAVLAERAAKLAHVYAQPAESDAERVHLIAFSRGAHRYGVELRHLTEILPLEGWTPVPGVPEFLLGVIHLRGEIVAVVDLVPLFAAAPAAPPEEKFAVVVASGDVTTALLADSVDDVHDLTPDQIHPPLTTFNQPRERYIRGIADGGVSVVDVKKLLADDWLRVNHDDSQEDRR